VSSIDGYSCTPISNTDLDTLIEKEPDKTKIRLGVFVSRGHGFLMVQGPAWCWIFDTTLQTWHERNSYLKTYFRALYPVQAFGKWLCGDSDAVNLCEISALTRKDLGTRSTCGLRPGRLAPSRTRSASTRLSYI
jgi:hypothetical protein